MTENKATETEEQKTETQSSEKKSGNKTVARSFVSLISGNFLTKGEIVNHLPYLLFLSLIAIIYISNSYYAQDTIRKIDKLNHEIKELRSEHITAKSDLMYKSKQSEVAKLVEEKGIGLKESVVPPKKIIVEKNKD
jgi:cell division protein FtsL